LNLFKKNNPTDMRANALFALGEGNLRQINKIIPSLLRDKSDEIRLLAFNIQDQQEGLLSEDIEKLLALLESPELEPDNKAKIEKTIALLYWEFIYRNLLLPELEPSTLAKAEYYALSAVKVLADDATLWGLLGKIYQRAKQYDKAEQAFNKIREFNTSPSKVLPYLAEIKFRMRDYAAVRQYLAESDILSDVAMVAPVKRFWSRK
jgi:polysaccharide biosynthesis protein PelE